MYHEEFEDKRRQLFSLIWSRPATEVAKEMGISDVAVGKLCRRLQVPKPPRGYWARVASGRKPRHPALPAYREELAKKIRQSTKSSSQVRLTKLQLRFLDQGLQELNKAGMDTSACKVIGDGIKSAPAELLSHVLILIQNQYDKWISDRTTATSLNAAHQSLSNLVDKLLPHAKEQVLVFRPKRDKHQRETHGPTLTIKMTDSLLRRISQLSTIAKEQRLTYLVTDMSGLEHAWAVNYIYSPDKYYKSESYLCVSAKEIWVRVDMKEHWSHDQYETERIPLTDIGPIELVPQEERRLPSSIRRSWIKPYAKRINALREAHAIYESLLEATFDMEQGIPSEKLAMFDRLIMSGSGEGPFVKARQAWRALESDLQRWEKELEAETVCLCQDVLGIDIGDTVVVDSGKSTVRLAVKGMSLYPSDERILFSLWGKRFRKDGLPGKRDESFFIEVSNDSS
ncbi:MAG: hypothetical protein ABW077_20250 [Candidatus Thiodiazotropha endolucinida]